MRKPTGRSGTCHDLALVMFLIGSGCTGVASLPGGSPGGPSGAGAGQQPSGTGNTGATPAGGGGSSATAPIPGKSAWDQITPTTQLDPGRTVLRRLNNAEYDNTVHDLLGTMTRPSQDQMFASDNVNMDGFDTVGEVLSYSSLLFEAQDAAADGLLTELMNRPKTDPLRTRVLSCEPTTATMATCAPQILKTFMTSAYRRPATDAEVADLVTLATSNTDPVKGITDALKVVLMSPHFLFHVETSGSATSAAPAKLTDYEVASRLSYFLWSTMPDPQLMAAAAAAKLAPAGADYTSQVNRLMADPTRFQAFVDNYTGQALTLRDAKLVAPVPELYPTFDDALRLSSATETSTFFGSLIQDAQPLTSLLLADFTFVNGRLAKQYGLSGVPAAQTTFTKVTLPATSNRMGILSQESFLTVTSMPDRTSPVKRGNWILDQLVCDSSPAPPPAVKPLITPAVGSGLSVKAALAAHRASPSCAICHNTIDPLGLAFENFDAIGTYRTTDNGAAVDVAGQLADGRTYGSAKDLSTLIASDPRFARCMVKQALTYAVGRSFEGNAGRGYAAGMADPLAKASATWPDLLRTVATSEAFLTHRGEGP